MTKHRIEADKVVIEDDRRVRQYDEADKALPDDVEADRRMVHYDYSQPFKIIYVPLEPQPTKFTDYYHWNGKDYFKDSELIANSPFHPDDTLLDSQCQKYNVVKVLGVEEKMISPDPLADGIWHSVLLGKEK